MPRITQQSIPQVQLQGYGGNFSVQASAEDFGAGTGRQLQALGQKIKAEDDENKANKALTEWNQKVRTMMHDPDKGYLNTKGSNAYEGYAGLQPELDKMRGEIADTLSESQKKMFLGASNTSYESYLNSAARHASAERRADFVATKELAVEDTLEDAAAFYNSPEDRMRAMKRGEMELNELGDDEGWSPERRQERLESYRSSAHQKVIDRMIQDQEFDQAKQYYDENLSQIEGDRRGKIEEIIAEGVMTNEARRQVDQLYDPDRPINELAEEARKKNKDTKLADDIVERMKVRRREDEEAKSQANKEAFSSAFDVVDQGGSSDAIDRGTWNKLTPEQKNAIRTREKKGTPATDNQVWYSLFRMSQENPKEFQNLNLLEFRNSLDNEDFQEVSKWQKGESQGGVRTIANEVSKQALRAIGVDPGNAASKSDAKKVEQFTRKLWDRINETGAQTRDDIEAISDQLLLEGEVEGGLIDPNKRYFEVQEGQRFFIDDIPREERAKITEALKRNGRPVTDQAIEDLYTRKRLNGG